MAALDEKNAVCGGFGFDPLGLYNFFAPGDEGKRKMETAEIKNGRLAMLAITGMAIQEALLQKPVVEQTPFFFKPIWDQSTSFAAASSSSALDDTAASAAAMSATASAVNAAANAAYEFGSAPSAAELVDGIEPMKESLADAIPAITEAASAAVDAVAAGRLRQHIRGSARHWGGSLPGVLLAALTTSPSTTCAREKMKKLK